MSFAAAALAAAHGAASGSSLSHRAWLAGTAALGVAIPVAGLALGALDLLRGLGVIKRGNWPGSSDLWALAYYAPIETVAALLVEAGREGWRYDDAARAALSALYAARGRPPIEYATRPARDPMRFKRFVQEVQAVALRLEREGSSR